jgi:hypothetical protein
VIEVRLRPPALAPKGSELVAFGSSLACRTLAIFGPESKKRNSGVQNANARDALLRDPA